MSFAINAPAELLPSAPPSPPEPPLVAPVGAASENSGAGDASQAGVGGQGGNASQGGSAQPEPAGSDAREQVTSEAQAQQNLTEAEQRELRELQARDREVRAHEAAHAAAAGSLARGAPTYTYARGPDGRQYAVGGEVQIDTGVIAGDPRATLEKAQQIQRAALAPGEPSAQDRAVAAAAAQMATEARAELADSSKLSCPECGGEHDAAAHQGLSTYAEVAGAEPPRAVETTSAASAEN
ncbi:MAG: putative metalloprotease CJM1_0395 family protein [Pseudomonadota bacterium]